MKIEYENNFSDVFLFNAIHQFLSPVLQGFYLLFAGFIFVSELSESSPLVAILAACVAYMGMWLIQLVFNVFYLYSRKNRSILTTHVIGIQEDGLLEETKYNRSIFFWNGIVKVVRRPGFVAIYVTPHMAHIIPMRAFSSQAHGHDFMQAINRKLHSA